MSTHCRKGKTLGTGGLWCCLREFRYKVPFEKRPVLAEDIDMADDDDKLNVKDDNGTWNDEDDYDETSDLYDDNYEKNELNVKQWHNFEIVQ